MAFFDACAAFEAKTSRVVKKPIAGSALSSIANEIPVPESTTQKNGIVFT